MFFLFCRSGHGPVTLVTSSTAKDLAKLPHLRRGCLGDGGLGSPTSVQSQTNFSADWPPNREEEYAM